MLLAFFICSTIALSIANPFHKYPYVFLLDVGNEELEKTNTEQLRVSIPGGSLALKYPVLGEGDTISHVRVSGIDFGTDLKVNIVDGGPGYKYVLLVFMGNPGVTYDAVVTLQTLPNGLDTDIASTNVIDDNNANVNDNTYKMIDAESDDYNAKPNYNSNSVQKYNKKSNSQVMQSSSTFYNYAKNAMTNDDDNDDEQEDLDEEQDDDADAPDEEDNDEQSLSDETSNEEDDYDEHDKEETFITQSKNQDIDMPRAEQYTSDDGSNTNDYKPPDIVDDSLYEKYQDLKPHFADGFRVYPKSSMYSQQFQVSSAYDKEDPVEIEQMFNDEEVHNDAKYSDGVNSIDSDYQAAEY